MTKQNKSRGFTIVELLIVIVIIAILAAITIVAYNGIQARANASAAQSAANTIQKKIEAYNALNSGYPNATTFNTSALLTGELNKDDTTKLTGTNLALGKPTADNGKTTIGVTLCANKGAIITYWDYAKQGGAALTSTTATGNKSITLGDTTSCTEAPMS